MQGRTLPRVRAVICWWGNRCLFGKDERHHRLTSGTRELASSTVSLPYLFELGSAMSVGDRDADENGAYWERSQRDEIEAEWCIEPD